MSLGAGREEPTPSVSPAPQTTALEQSTAAPTPTAPPPTKLPLKEQVGKLVVLRFNGTTVPTYVKDVLRKGWAAGVILFKDNITDPAQLKTMTAELRKASPKVVPIICTDQEGGVIRNLTWAPPANGQANQVAGRDAKAAAQALRAAGLNVSLAPVADVPSVDNAAMGTRAFSRDATVVAAKTKAAVEGWMAGKVAPTAKHFPGLGGTTVNTDRGSTSIPNAPTSSDLAPFKAAIDADVPLIMSSHARYPRLDGQRIASQSHAILDHAAARADALQRRRDHGQHRGRGSPRDRLHGADRGPFDHRRQRHRPDHRAGIVDPVLPRVAQASQSVQELPGAGRGVGGARVSPPTIAFLGHLSSPKRRLNKDLHSKLRGVLSGS